MEIQLTLQEASMVRAWAAVDLGSSGDEVRRRLRYRGVLARTAGLRILQSGDGFIVFLVCVL